MKKDAARLKTALGALGLSQSVAAKKAGLSPTYINDVLANVNAASEERKRRAITVDALRALAGSPDLRISSDYLLGIGGAPLRVAQTFNEGLANALSEYVAAHAIDANSVPEAWLRDVLVEAINPTEYLESVVKETREEIQSLATALRKFGAAAVEIRLLFPGGKEVPDEILNATGELPKATGLLKINSKGFQKFAQHIVEEEKRRRTRKKKGGSK